ncbi:MAG: hypothetical protein ACRD3M_10750, partial [Thermoanaerobaculia bacterium]
TTVVQVMAALALCSWVSAAVVGGKDVLPAPLGVGRRLLPAQGVRQEDAAEALGEILLVKPLDA